MRPLARRRSCKRSKLLCCGGSRACRAGAERRRVGCSTLDDNYKRFTRAIITIIFCPLLAAFAQELTPTPTPQTAGEPVATTFQVIVPAQTFLLLKTSGHSRSTPIAESISH